MISAILVSTVIGWLFLIAFFFGIHDYQATVNTSTGFPITQILLDNFSREWTLVFICLLLVACWFCGLASVTTNSRMIYAFSRDHAMVIIALAFLPFDDDISSPSAWFALVARHSSSSLMPIERSLVVLRYRIPSRPSLSGQHDSVRGHHQSVHHLLVHLLRHSCPV